MVTEYQHKSLQTDLHKAAKIIDEQQTEIERLKADFKTAFDEAWKRGCEIERLKERIALLEDVAVAAEDDWEGAIANCGKYPESGKDCSAWIERGLRCSDCPTEVWMGSTGVALDKLRDTIKLCGEAAQTPAQPAHADLYQGKKNEPR